MFTPFPTIEADPIVLRSTMDPAESSTSALRMIAPVTLSVMTFAFPSELPPKMFLFWDDLSVVYWRTVGRDYLSGDSI